MTRQGDRQGQAPRSPGRQRRWRTGRFSDVRMLSCVFPLQSRAFASCFPARVFGAGVFHGCAFTYVRSARPSTRTRESQPIRCVSFPGRFPLAGAGVSLQEAERCGEVGTVSRWTGRRGQGKVRSCISIGPLSWLHSALRLSSRGFPTLSGTEKMPRVLLHLASRPPHVLRMLGLAAMLGGAAAYFHQPFLISGPFLLS